MSQIPPYQDQIQATQTTDSAAPGSDSNIVDRTQQLIDEVNKLLGAGTGISATTPVAPAAPAASATAASAIAPAPQQEITPVVPVMPAVPSAVAPAEPVVQFAEPDQPVLQLPEVLQAPQVEIQTPELPVTATPAAEVPVLVAPEVTPTPQPAAETSSDSSDLGSFLNGLMNDSPSETDSLLVETSEAEATPAPIEDAAVEATYEETPTATGDVENAFDIAALKSVFESDANDEPTAAESDQEIPTQAPTLESVLTENTFVETPETDIAAEAEVEEPAVSSETSAILSELNSLVDELPTDSTEPADSVETEATETTASVLVEEPVAVEDVAAVEATTDESTEEPEEDKRSFTERYLEQFRDSLDDNSKTETESPASESVANDPAPTLEPESAEMCVENWLARNIGSSDEEESEDSEEQPADTEASVVPESTDEAAPEIEPVVTASVLEETEESPEEEVEPAHDFASLEASFTRQIRKLEQRFGRMFSSLSGQPIEDILPPQPTIVDDTPVDSMTASTVECLKTELEEKLRKAEVELSINRAKMSQQTVKLEQMQADLERREAALERKLERQKTNSNGEEVSKEESKANGLMDRWKRHLG